MLELAKLRMWPEKYRPTNLSEYDFQNSQHEESFNKILTSKVTPHIMLSGVAGTGKSAIARLIVDACLDPDHIDVDLLKMNASDTNSIDDVRDTIKSHILSYSAGDFKIVWLEEADQLSPNAQAALKDYMETYESHCRFIFTCNNLNKMADPIRSRCQQFTFLAGDKNKITERVATILLQEKIVFDLDTLDAHINLKYPDMRAILNGVQQFSTSGTLTMPTAADDVVDSSKSALMIQHMANDQWDTLREVLGTTVMDDEWVEIYSFLYSNLNSAGKFKDNRDMWNDGIVLIAEAIYRHPTYAKPHINAASLLVQLGQL